MSKNTLPRTSGASKVTFTNLILQLGQCCRYTDFTPMPILRDSLRPLANPGIHELEKWILNIPVSMEVRPAAGSYQCAVLRHAGQGVAVIHAGLDISSGAIAWNAAHLLNQRFIASLCSMGPKEATADLSPFLQTCPELVPPIGPALVTSLMPGIAAIPTVLHVLEDFTRQLFWALHERHITSKWMAA